MLRQASQDGEEEFLSFLLGETEEVPQEPGDHTGRSRSPSRLRLYPDRDFLLEGYRYLASENENYRAIQDNDGLLLLTAPTDLQRRLGASSNRTDMISRQLTHVDSSHR